MEAKMIGNKIAQARKAINISQAQLAERLFISPQAVGKWERGESVPDIITVTKLAALLAVDLNYFSENFPSVIKEPTAAVTPESQPVDAPGPQPEPRRSWDMSQGNWVDADFSGLKNLHEKFGGSNMQRCKFIGSDMSGLLLKGNNVDSCDFSGSDMSGSQFQKCHLANNLFNDCSLAGAEFSSYMKNCNFSGADLTGTIFKSSSFVKSVLHNAVLKRTSFVATDIADVIFEGPVEDCYFENSAYTRVAFQNATLVNTFFKGVGLKKIRFIDCRADRMTYEFLKNGKADLEGITLLTV